MYSKGATIIRYLKPTTGYKTRAFSKDDIANPPVAVIEEDISDVLNLYRCRLYLELYGGAFNWTPMHWHRCYQIMLICLERANECDNCFFYTPFFAKHGVFTTTKRKEAIWMFNNPNFVIDNSFRAEYSNEKNRKLFEIVKDDTLYKEFLDFWLNLPTFQQYQDVMCLLFPRDIANIILSIVCESENEPNTWKLHKTVLRVRAAVKA